MNVSTSAALQVANLRVQVNDIDDVTQPDLIDEYDCIFDIGRIASDISSAEWSTVLECRSLHHPTKPFVKYVRPRRLDKKSLMVSNNLLLQVVLPPSRVRAAQG